MPRLALAICVFWVLSVFVFRSVLQWRRTGSAGFKGLHSQLGPLTWLASVAIVLCFALALLAPLGVLLGWPGSALLVSAAWLHAAGAALALLGTVGTLAAQLTMGDSWRIGVDASEETELVTGGLFARVRNPIFSFMFLSLLGLLLLIPTALSALAFVLGVAGVEVHVRTVEEPYLARTHGEAYARYAASVGRFVPGVGRLDPPGPHPG